MCLVSWKSYRHQHIQCCLEFVFYSNDNGDKELKAWYEYLKKPAENLVKKPMANKARECVRLVISADNFVVQEIILSRVNYTLESA
jgi:hypothetical protein